LKKTADATAGGKMLNSAAEYSVAFEPHRLILVGIGAQV